MIGAVIADTDRAPGGGNVKGFCKVLADEDFSIVKFLIPKSLQTKVGYEYLTFAKSTLRKCLAENLPIRIPIDNFSCLDVKREQLDKFLKQEDEKLLSIVQDATDNMPAFAKLKARLAIESAQTSDSNPPSSAS